MIEAVENKINIERHETPERPLLNRLWLRVEETLAISTGLSSLAIFYPSEIRVADFGGITLGLWPEINMDPGFIATTAILAGTYIATRGLRVIARESLRKIDTLTPGV